LNGTDPLQINGLDVALSQSLIFFANESLISSMSKVEQVKSELRMLSPDELQQVRDWLDDFVEDQMEFTTEFEVAIQQSETEMKSGARPRIRRS
jgi:hypothetical protein